MNTLLHLLFLADLETVVEDGNGWAGSEPVGFNVLYVGMNLKDSTGEFVN